MIRRVTGWAGPAAGVAAVLAAVVGVTYANESRVNVSMPGAAVILSGGPGGAGSTKTSSGHPGVTLVYPRRSVDVLPGTGDTSATPSGDTPSATAAGPAPRTAAGARPAARPTDDHSETGGGPVLRPTSAPDGGAVAPVQRPTSWLPPPIRTDEENSTRSPRPQPSPTASPTRRPSRTPSPSPSPEPSSSSYTPSPSPTPTDERSEASRTSPWPGH